MKYLWIYLVVINIIAFFMYGIDKRKAIEHKWRISENTLLLFSLIGGGIGSFIGMSVFHHKTKTLKFRVWVPLLTIISIVYIYFIVKYL